MPTIQLPANNWRPRDYQRPAWNAWERGIKRQLLVWHRRAGKDELNLNQHAVAAHMRVGTYWHMLPEYAQARKAIWDAVNPNTGKRRIDEAFPHEIRDNTRDNDMFIRFKTGSTWQVVGSDNFDALVGTPPVGITLSEWALANPTAWGYLSPILTENGGWASFISTPRGSNHLKRMYDQFKDDPAWFVQRLGVNDTHAVGPEAIESQRKEYRALFGDEEADMLVEQEFHCSWAGASVGAILARLVDKAEQEGRISDDVVYDPDGAPIDVISDIGFWDTASWWFVQRTMTGYRYVKYIGKSGMDAEDWIELIQKVFEEEGWELGKIYLPPDAKAKTFRAKKSSAQMFIEGFGMDHIGDVPPSKQFDQVNAARTTMPVCEFNETECAEGLDGLRGWQYTFNDETRTFSREPKHDWASHPGQAYAYSCQVMALLPIPKPSEKPGRTLVIKDGEGYKSTMTLDDAWENAMDRAPTGRIR